MKNFLCVLVSLLAVAGAKGQDSLDVRYVRSVPGGYILFVDDTYRVGVETVSSQGEWMDYYDTTYIAIYDNHDPAWPSRVWRGLPVVGWGVYGVEYNAFIFSAAELRDSLIYAVQSYYNVYDYPGGFLYSNLICYDWVNEDTLWLREFHYDYDGEYIRPFALPRGLEIENNKLAVGLGINGFYVFDISDPRYPQESFVLEKSTIDLVTIGNRLVLCSMDTMHRNDFHTLKLLDWHDPCVALDSVFIDDAYLYHVQLGSSGTRLFMGFEDSIGVWRITDQDRFELSIGIHPGDDIYSFNVSCDTVAIGMDQRFELWRASDENEPEMIGRVVHGEPYRVVGTVLRGEWIYRESNTIWDIPMGGSIDMFHLGPVSAPAEGINPPSGFILHAPYPNPFNSNTIIKYELPRTGNVLIDVIDINGRSYFHQSRSGKAGENHVIINGADLPSGTYLIQIETPTEMQSRRVSLVR